MRKGGCLIKMKHDSNNNNINGRSMAGGLNDGRPVGVLCADLERAVGALVRRLRERVTREDSTLEMVTDASVLLSLISVRLQQAGASSGKRMLATAAAVEDERGDAQQQALDRAQLDVSLMDVLDDEDVSLPEWRRRQLEDLIEQLVHGNHSTEVAVLHRFVRDRQVETLRSMIRYIWHGARSPWEMMKRALAITRRYQQEQIRGISMTEVAALLNEGSRCAATSARERNVHDTLLRAWGIRAPKAADGALKGDGACEKSRVAALGNQNRKGKMLKR